MKKAQFTIEFMITIGFLLTMFFFFQAYLWQKAGNGLDAASIQEAKAIGTQLQNQFYAAQNNNGYSARVLLPDTFQNFPYILTLYTSSIVLEWNNHTYEAPVTASSISCPSCYSRPPGYAVSNPVGYYYVNNTEGVIWFYAGE